MSDYGCGKCAYWLLIDGTAHLGYCRFNPPCVPDEHSGHMLSNGSGIIVKHCNWPVTKQDQYCAQFKRAKAPSTKEGSELRD